MRLIILTNTLITVFEELLNPLQSLNLKDIILMGKACVFNTETITLICAGVSKLKLNMLVKWVLSSIEGSFIIDINLLPQL